MKAYISISTLWYNGRLMDFFFREQAKKTLEELVNASALSTDRTLAILDIDTYEEDLDEIEESFYTQSVEQIAEEYGIELSDE